MLKENEKTFSNFQKFFDALMVSLSWWIAYHVRFNFLPDGELGLFPLFLKITPILVFLNYYTFSKNDLYKSQRFSSRYFEILRVFRANSTSIIVMVLALYFFADEKLSRTTIILYFAVSSFMLITARLLVRNFLRSLRRRGRNLRHVLLVGNAVQLDQYVRMAKKYKDCGLNFIGWIESGGKSDHYSIREFNSLEDAKNYTSPDVIVVSYAGEDSSKLSNFLKSHYNDVIPIQVLPDLSYSLVGHNVEDFAGIPLLTVNQPNFSSIELYAKRFLDFILTFAGGLLISPILLGIAFGVKFSSPGPIFFGQRRLGVGGREFTMWKFRSMRMAEDDKHTKEWSNKDNPRKTKFGSFLRKTSLDELPQLWNVLIGQMSLVGPRPEQPYFVGKFRGEIPGYMLRHKMRPGITGWAQVNGWRGDTSLQKRIECDIYYIKHWSIWFDIKILFLTFWKGFINKNAY